MGCKRRCHKTLWLHVAGIAAGIGLVCFMTKTKKGRKYYGCEDNPTCEYMSWNKPAKKSHLPLLTGGICYWQLALDSGLWSCPSKQVFSSWAMASSAMICITVAVTEEASSTPTVTVA